MKLSDNQNQFECAEGCWPLEKREVQEFVGLILKGRDPTGRARLRG